MVRGDSLFVALISESAQAYGRANVAIQLRFMCFAPNRFQRYGKTYS